DNANLTKYINVESAGTIGYHAGEHPDPRATAMAQSRKVDISNLIAQKVTDDDYLQQTYILAMDYDNLQNLQSECPESQMDKLELLLSYHPDKNLKEVPDPYYGGDKGFVNVYEMIEQACENLLAHIKTENAF
ncbi:MAG: low molecular weight phosphotyrosine protein phosphatase, partial [Gammaproteobacteria bacterium]|nr:low molecular weight phosphotyrosine protein phosphatase [Gammaproteobacteria bacterium]